MELCRICKLNYAHIHLIAALVFIKNPLNCLKTGDSPINYLDTSTESGIKTFTYNADFEEVYMAKPRTSDHKEKALRESGALNTHPVSDALFSDSDFFDSRDLVQVKYEMLRKVHKDGQPISDAAASFGFSRPAFYKTSADFQREGITGLLPRKRGPRGGHKLTADVLKFIKTMRTAEQPLGTPALLDEVRKRFGIRVHRRSLERALRRSEKKTPPIPAKKDRTLK
jgi:transposase